MRIWVCAGLCAAGAAAGFGQDGGPPPLPAVDPEIKRILEEISPERLQRSVFVLSSFKTRHTLSDQDPSGDGIGAAAGWIRNQMERAKSGAPDRLTVKEDSFIQKPDFPRIPQPVRITNLVATLAGTRAGSARRVYIVSAHYDSRVRNPLDATSPAPGADDDGSGVAAVLELERVMARYDFPATLRFIAFAGEEQGLNGSAHYAAEAARRGDEIEGVLNNDIIGSTHGPDGRYERNRVRLFAAGVPTPARWTENLRRLMLTGAENDLPPRQLARAVTDCARAYVPAMNVQIIYRPDRYLRGGDQNSFVNEGYPAVRFTEPWEDYHHEHQEVRTENGISYGDVADNLDYVYLGDVTRVNAAVLANLARAPAPPQGVEIEAAQLTNETTLRWQAPVEPGVAGYRVVWRDTTAPSWQHHQDFAPGQTRVTLALNKDDLVFGVEAFDSEGHISYAVYPTPRSTL